MKLCQREAIGFDVDHLDKVTRETRAPKGMLSLQDSEALLVRR